MQLNVLQVCAELFVKIQTTKHANKLLTGGIHEIELGGLLIPFKPECGLFITLNPYVLGRQKLPSNLKNLFRVVTMVKPDSTLIAQTRLMNAGFDKNKALAHKIIKTF